MSDQQTHCFTFYSSKQLIVIMIVLYGGAFYALFYSELSWWLTLIFSAGLLFSLSIFLIKAIRHILSMAKTTLYFQENGVVLMTGISGNRSSIALKGSSLVTRYVIILNFYHHTRQQNSSLVLLQDSMDKDSWRRLRVKLCYPQNGCFQ